MRPAKQGNATDFFGDAAVKVVPDEELKQLAEAAGPSSTAAAMLQAIKEYRAKDRQVFAFRINDYFFCGSATRRKDRGGFARYGRASKSSVLISSSARI